MSQDYNLYAQAAACIHAGEIDDKLTLTREIAQAWRSGVLQRKATAPRFVIEQPGLPEALEIVDPRKLVQRGLGTADGLAAFLHAVAHIEYSAINLAWDAVHRFRHFPKEYYDDWVRVAEEEAYHFSLLRARLQELGRDYGDYPAHSGLWDIARSTANDPLLRMALVPRLQEARGLDVTPGMIKRLLEVDDSQSADILQIILRDEVVHVAIGTRWFEYLCHERGLEPESSYREILAQADKLPLKGPLNKTARLEAGFSEAELEALSHPTTE